MTARPGQKGIVGIDEVPDPDGRDGDVSGTDTHLTYMIDIALTTEFSLATGGAR